MFLEPLQSNETNGILGILEVPKHLLKGLIDKQELMIFGDIQYFWSNKHENALRYKPK